MNAPVVDQSADLAAELRRAGHPVVVHDAARSPVQPAGGQARTCVTLLTEWTPATSAELSRQAWRAVAPRVPVRLDGGLVLVGPVLRAGATTCLACAEQERLQVIGHQAAGQPSDLRLGGLLPPVALCTLAGVVASVLAEPDRYDGVVVALRADHATVSTHRVRPRRPGCPVCAPLPADAPLAARVELAPEPTSGPYTLRAANPRTGREQLRAALYDWRHGPIGHVRRTERLPLPLVTAEIVGDRSVREAGYGRAVTYPEAERVALFEAVERYTGSRPHRRRTALQASFQQLGPERAVDPVRLGLHEARYASHPAFQPASYTPETQTTWVYGWSMRDRRPVAVPEHVAYWDLPHSAGGTRFLYESSNGCGLGNSLVEAILYGLFEVAERDAFLMAWYARTPLHRIAPPDQDPLVPHLVDRLDAIGYELMFFDASNDLGVPAVLTLAHHREGDPAAPQAFFAAGAHPDPRAAIRGAAVEVAVNVLSMPELVRERPGHLDRERLVPMLTEPERVRTLRDHIALNTLPEARSRYEFLLTGSGAGAGDPVDWRELWPGQPAPVDDLTRALHAAVERLAGLGLEVLAVDQTDPLLRDRLGLHSAKVIVPGTLAMTFGHVHHRTRGLPRLLRVPHRLGRLPAPLRYEDLPLDPHPFP